MANFDSIFTSILFREGGYSNHQADKGGATKYGVTQGTLDFYLKRYDDSFPKSVGQLKAYEAKQIYKELYWYVIQGEKILSQEMAEIILDQAINAGPEVTVKRLQNSINYVSRHKVLVDGILGKKTLSVLNHKGNTRAICLEFVIQTQLFYAKIVRNNPSQSAFIVGWMKRSHKLLDLAFQANR